MKRFVAYLMLMVMVVQLSNRVGFVVWFKANQERIAAVFCVNKFTPSKHCDGKCFMVKALKQDEERQSGPATSVLKNNQEQVQWCGDLSTRVAPDHSITLVLTQSRTASITKGFSVPVFQPPCLLFV